ncbi:glycosyltransferase family 2 protein, partial [Roseisolibacter sp. H3M3-2]|uniref:glycosyltransferase family 2 protein n=1 Tax=Roseisolibacter sp. H3M3-2 TaxID=3031323 RepID=UPI0023DB3400
MLYVCIPVHNEAATIGVLLWRIRAVLQDYTREYEVVVFDDGSTDATAEVLEPYRRVLPLTVLRSATRRGTAAAVDVLCRHVAGHTRYPRRDAAVFMQGDFTDRPEDLPELAKRFEGGADLIVGRRPPTEQQPLPERRLRKLAPWVLRPFVRAEGLDDLVTGFRLVRVSVLRDLARARGDAPVAEGAGWAALVDFALAVLPFARRVEVVDLPGRYDLRPRESRLDWWRDLRVLAGYAWRARGRRVAAGSRLGERAPE